MDQDRHATRQKGMKLSQQEVHLRLLLEVRPACGDVVWFTCWDTRLNHGGCQSRVPREELAKPVTPIFQVSVVRALARGGNRRGLVCVQVYPGEPLTLVRRVGGDYQGRAQASRGAQNLCRLRSPSYLGRLASPHSADPCHLYRPNHIDPCRLCVHGPSSQKPGSRELQTTVRARQRRGSFSVSCCLAACCREPFCRQERLATNPPRNQPRSCPAARGEARCPRSSG